MILGYVEYEGKVYPYTDKDTNGYEIQYDNVYEIQWVDARGCKEVEAPEEAKEPLNEFEKAVYNKCIDLAQTLINKNRDYGDSFKLLYDEYGDYSTEWRLTDKLNRYKTLNKKENLVKDESKEDTLLDMAGYSILTLVTKELNK